MDTLISDMLTSLLLSSDLLLQIETGVDALAGVQSLVSAMGPALLMPVVVFLLGVAVRLPVMQTVRSALLVGVGFVGIFALLGYVLGPIGETMSALATVWGLNLVGIDIGWAPIAAFSWAMGVTTLLIPIGLAVNLALLAVGWTRTLDADIWNYWQWAFNAAIVYVVTGSWVLGLAAAVVTEVITLRLADWTADLGQAYFDIPGTSLPHTQSALQAPFAFAIDRCLRCVPVVGSVDVSPAGIERRLGAVGDPIVLGFVVGSSLGALARQPLLETFRTGVYVAGLLALLPRIVELLVEGLDPIVQRASDRVNDSDRFGGDTIVVGIDAGPIAFSDTTAVVAGLALIPYALGLAFVPGVVVMPLADLVALPVFCIWAAAISGGNLVRTILSGAVVTTVMTAVTTLLAPYITEMGRVTGELQSVDAGGAELVSALSAGGHWWSLGLFAPLGLSHGVSVLVAGVGVASALAAYACYCWTREMPARAARRYEADTASPTEADPDSEPTDAPAVD